MLYHFIWYAFNIRKSFIIWLLRENVWFLYIQICSSWGVNYIYLPQELGKIKSKSEIWLFGWKLIDYKLTWNWIVIWFIYNIYESCQHFLFLVLKFLLQLTIINLKGSQCFHVIDKIQSCLRAILQLLRSLENYGVGRRLSA